MSKPVSSSSASPRIRAGWWAATVLYAGAIAIVSVMPIPPTTPSAWLSLDKAVHLCEYGLLAWLLMMSARRSAWAFGASCLTAFAGATAYGTLWEAVQMFLPYRSAEVGDLVVNTLGAGIGVGIAISVSTPKKKRE